jgi:flagellar protein FliS
MNATSHNALGHYRAVNAYGAVAGDRLQLILDMMDTAADRVRTAKGHMRRKEIPAKGREIGRAIGIIEGLRTSLDQDKGGDIAGNLGALYEYMERRLLEANLGNDEARLDEVADLLEEIRSGWAAILQDPQALAAATARDTAGA